MTHRLTRSTRLAVVLPWTMVATLASAQPTTLTSGGLKLGAAKPEPPGHLVGQTRALAADGRTCRAYDPATQRPGATTLTLTLPSDAPAQPSIVSAPLSHSPLVVWITQGRIRWLPVTCDAATQQATPGEVALPASWPDRTFEGARAVALAPNGTLTLSLKAGLVDVDTQTGVLTTVASYEHTAPVPAEEDWRVRFVPQAERPLLHGFSARTLAYTRTGEAWAVLQRNSNSTNMAMDLWLLRRRAGTRAWEVLREEHAGDPGSLLLLPFQGSEPLMRYVAPEDVFWFLTWSFEQSSPQQRAIISVVADPKRARPFNGVAQPLWLYHRGWPSLVDGADVPWTIASTPDILTPTWAPIVFDDPQADVDRDGLARTEELALGSSDFSHDSDDDGAPDSFEARRGTDPRDPAAPPAPSLPGTQQLAFSTRVMDWPYFGNYPIAHITPGAFCQGNPELPRSCPLGSSRCIYSGHLCVGVDAGSVGPVDVPGRSGDFSFMLGRYDAWVRHESDGGWLLGRPGSAPERLAALEEAAGREWSLLAALAEDDLWLWSQDRTLLHWRAGQVVARAEAAGVVPVGYSRSLGTFLVSAILPGEEFGPNPDRYLFAVDGAAARGLRLIGSARNWGLRFPQWLKPVGETSLEVLGSLDGVNERAASVSIDPWGREVLRMDRPNAPSFHHDLFRNGAVSQQSIGFIGAPAEFGAGECPWYVDPITCGNPNLQNLPIPRLIPLYGELTPISARLLAGDLVLAAPDGLWLHREQGGVHAWLPAARWPDYATPETRADLLRERAVTPAISHLELAPDAGRLCVVMNDGRLLEWTLREGLPAQLTLLRAEGVKACGYEAGGQRLVATERAVEREGAAPLTLPGEFGVIGLRVSGATALVHGLDQGVPTVQCVPLSPGGQNGQRVSVAALTADRGVVSWAEAINTLDGQPSIATQGHAWVAPLEDFCGGQPREHLAVGASPTDATSVWHSLHALGGMIDPGEKLKILRGVMARRPDGVLLMSSVQPRTRPRGTGGSAGEYIYAYPHRVTPSYEPLPGATPIAAHDAFRRGPARIWPIHDTLKNVTAMATVPGEVPDDYGLSSKYDCWADGCKRVPLPEPMPIQPPPEPAPPTPPGDPKPMSCLCGHGAAPMPAGAWTLLLLTALAWRSRQRPRRDSRSVDPTRPQDDQPDPSSSGEG